MIYLEAPDRLEEYDSPSVFLAGGITNCPHWQIRMIGLLKDEVCILFNPRRSNFDINQKDLTKEQIKWEFDHLWKADIIIFWFCKETIQPIVLLELGVRLGQYRMNKNYSPELVIGIEHGYTREEDVFIQTELAFGGAPVIHRTLEDVAQRTKNILKKSILDHIYLADKSGDEVLTLDLILKWLDEKLNKPNFSSINRFLEDINVEKLSDYALLAILTHLKYYNKFLPSGKDFFDRVEEKLQRELNESEKNELLEGLNPNE